jgi:hypothetical protein
MAYIQFQPVAMLAFFQATQLNLFERFLTQARSGIDSTGITSGMQNVAYVVLLVGFLWQVYQSALHGGDVRGLGTGLIKYVVTQNSLNHQFRNELRLTARGVSSESSAWLGSFRA